jgi:hypothetical protein
LTIAEEMLGGHSDRLVLLCYRVPHLTQLFFLNTKPKFLDLRTQN